ncbi:MAG TPA: hypothetical protein VJP45_06615 [Candidatus Limnocylindria bacterium]|nr:hypothetical protein [Candidatus Limnocylindria bacterium]
MSQQSVGEVVVLLAARHHLREDAVVWLDAEPASRFRVLRRKHDKPIPPSLREDGSVESDTLCVDPVGLMELGTFAECPVDKVRRLNVAIRRDDISLHGTNGLGRQVILMPRSENGLTSNDQEISLVRDMGS